VDLRAARWAGSDFRVSGSSLLERLRAQPLFADLDEEALVRLAAETTELEAPAGQLLIEYRAPGSGLFVLEEGKAVVDAPDGHFELSPGDVFGERALLGDNVPRAARVRAETDVRCLAIARPAIDRLLQDEPRIGERLRQLAG
jgi:CRP-like cAMP-binding protein